MSFFCAISGEPPQHPVISPKSGLVYERRLIVAHLNQHGTEPSTGEALNEDELIAVKTSPNAAPPRPPTLTSVPALLHTLQSEWDALVLETNTLRSQYIATRQELAHSLYQSDAATRVVARLVRERDEAREALANVSAATGMGAGAVTSNGNGVQEADVDMEAEPAEPAPLPDEIQEIIDEQYKALSSTRKKRKTPSVPSPARLAAEASETFPVPSGTKITSFALAPRLSASAFLTGTDDGLVRLWDAGSVVASLSGHKGAITALEWSASPASDEDSYIISGSEDTTVRLWSSTSPYDLHATLTAHTGAITGLNVHPSRKLLLSASQDGTFALHSLATAQLITRTTPSAGGGFASSALHPDGVLLALGLASAPQVQVYDIRTRALAVSLDLPSGSSAGVTALSFSENGYSMAAVSPSSTDITLFDLRKLSVQRTLSASFPVSGVSFDHAGAFVAAVGQEGGLAAWAYKGFGKVWEGEWKGEKGVVKWGTGAGAGKVWVAGAEGVSVWAPEV